MAIKLRFKKHIWSLSVHVTAYLGIRQGLFKEICIGVAVVYETGKKKD